jgi:hypothetical protein
MGKATFALVLASMALSPLVSSAAEPDSPVADQNAQTPTLAWERRCFRVFKLKQRELKLIEGTVIDTFSALCSIDACEYAQDVARRLNEFDCAGPRPISFPIATTTRTFGQTAVRRLATDVIARYALLDCPGRKPMEDYLSIEERWVHVHALVPYSTEDFGSGVMRDLFASEVRAAAARSCPDPAPGLGP